MRVKSVKLLRGNAKSLMTCEFKVIKCQLDDKIEDKLNSNMSLTHGDTNVIGTVGNCMKANTVATVKSLEGKDDHNPDDTQVQCEFCGKQYKNDKRLKDHIRFCHPKVYHKCIICSRQFPKKWILNTHFRKHTGEFPYSCSNCGEKFISNNQLQKHSNFHHKQTELFCKICNAFGFYTKQDLGNHLRTKHTKERAFQCDVCSKSFMSSGVYYQHRFIHKNIKKYSCKICCKAFGRWLTLHNHLRIHTN